MNLCRSWELVGTNDVSRGVGFYFNSRDLRRLSRSVSVIEGGGASNILYKEARTCGLMSLWNADRSKVLICSHLLINAILTRAGTLSSPISFKTFSAFLESS